MKMLSKLVTVRYYYLKYYLIITNFISIGTFKVHLTGFCVGLLLGFIIRRNYGLTKVMEKKLERNMEAATNKF